MKTEQVNKISQEYEGKKIEMSIPVIGPDIHDFMEMVSGFLKATGWNLSTIQSGFERAALDIRDEIESNDSKRRSEE